MRSEVFKGFGEGDVGVIVEIEVEGVFGRGVGVVEDDFFLCVRRVGVFWRVGRGLWVGLGGGRSENS